MDRSQMPSFFRPGGTLPLDARSYIHRQADEDLYACLHKGEFCYILSSRQIGKSSLMIQVAARMRQEGTTVAILDLNAIGHEGLTAEQWYFSLLMQLGERLDAEAELGAFWLSSPLPTPLQKWIAAMRLLLQRHPGRLLIFVDEIDQVRALSFSTTDFFAAIRSCYNRRAEEPEFARLTFCLIGTALPSELIHDPRLTPFNVGRRIELGDFTAEEVDRLKTGLGRDELVAEVLLTRIYHWTGGHPYLTQRLCQQIVDTPEIGTPQQVDALCHNLFFSREARSQDDNLNFVQDRLLQSGEDIAAILTLYRDIYYNRRIPDRQLNRQVELLQLAGIIRSDAGRLTVRNRIYREVFDPAWAQAHMPDAEWRRQRIAYRRGQARVGAYSLLILGVMAGFYANALHYAAIARQQTALARQRAVEADAAKTQALASARQADINAANAIEALNAEANARREALAQRELAVSREASARVAAERAAAARDAESSARLVATDAQAEALHNEKLALAARAEALHSKSVALKQRDAARRLLYLADMNLAQRAWESSDIGRIKDMLEETQDFRDRGFEWGYWNRLSHLAALTLTGHAAPILWVTYSPDSTRIATGGRDKIVKVWDARTGKELLTLNGYVGGSFGSQAGLFFSSDGNTIVADAGNKMVKAWNVQTGKELFTRNLNTPNVPIIGIGYAFSPDGQRIAGGVMPAIERFDKPPPMPYYAKYTTKIWETTGGKELLTLKGLTGALMFVAFDTRGDRIVTSGVQGGTPGYMTKIWDANTGTELCTLKDYHDIVRCFAFSPDGRSVVVCTQGRDVAQVWDVPSGQPRFTLSGHTGAISSVGFSPDGKRIVTGSRDQTVKVWDAQTGSALLTLKGHPDEVTAVAFSRDGQHLVTGGNDNVARIWNLDATDEMLTFAPPVKDVVDPGGSSGPVVPQFRALSADAARVIIQYNEDLTLWDIAAGKELFTLQGKNIHSIVMPTFSADGKWIAGSLFGSADSAGYIWNAATGEQLCALKGHFGPSGSMCIAFSPDNRTVFAGGWDGTARLWDARTGNELRTLQVKESMILSVAFSPHGKQVVTGGHAPNMPTAPPPGTPASTARIWDVATGKELRALNGSVDHLTFSPDGKLLAGVENRVVNVRDARTGKELFTLKGHLGAVLTVVFSPDGKRLLTGSADKTAIVWDAQTGRALLTLKGHTAGIRQALFSPDGKRIVTGGDDGAVKVWLSE